MKRPEEAVKHGAKLARIEPTSVFQTCFSKNAWLSLYEQKSRTRK